MSKGRFGIHGGQYIPETLMNVYSGLFLDYCILGGMPAVVREYIQKGTFEGTLDVQRQLLQDYKEDIRKYADGMDQTRILNVFEQIPIQLAKDNKKFQIYERQQEIADAVEKLQI